MRFFIISIASTLLLLSSNGLAGPTNPLSCSCEFEDVLPNGMGLVDATDCQISESTSYERERLGQGAFTETLSFAGGIGQACATLQIAKLRDGNDTHFKCKVWIQESRSSDLEDCEVITPRNWPVEDKQISRRNMRACSRLLDNVADEVLALPDCRAP